MKEMTRHFKNINKFIYICCDTIKVTKKMNIETAIENKLAGFKDLGNPNQYEYYMRRGNRIWLRNAYGKLSIEATELKQAIDGVKYGTKLIVDTGARQTSAQGFWCIDHSEPNCEFQCGYCQENQPSA